MCCTCPLGQGKGNPLQEEDSQVLVQWAELESLGLEDVLAAWKNP
jgi:hypothetical protein